MASAAAPAATAAPASAPAPAPVEAQQPSTTTVITAPTEEQPPKRRLTEKIMGGKATTDIEKQQTSDEEHETRRKKKVAAGLLGTLAMIAMITLGSLLLSGIAFVIGSYTFPMLACKMHGYSSQCMFNPYDKAGTSAGEWMSDNLPGKMGGFHRPDW